MYYQLGKLLYGMDAPGRKVSITIYAQSIPKCFEKLSKMTLNEKKSTIWQNAYVHFNKFVVSYSYELLIWNYLFCYTC